MDTYEFLNQQRKKESALDHVFNMVTSAIINGELNPGDRLPTETELSQNLGVGRNTVREAIKILEAYGVVSIRRPEGTFVNTSYSHKMLDPMIYGLLLKKQDWRGLIEMRGALEIGTLFLACDTVKPQDIKTLEEIVERINLELRKDDPSVDEVIEQDRCFHDQIAAITGNRMIFDVNGYITKFTIPSRRRTTEQIIFSKTFEPFVQKHYDIVDVLRNKDYGNIAKVVMNHYEYWIITT